MQLEKKMKRTQAGIVDQLVISWTYEQMSKSNNLGSKSLAKIWECHFIE